MTQINQNQKKEIPHAKVIDTENKIQSLNGLAFTAVVTAVKNKTPDISNLVKKDYDAKISEIENKVTDLDHDKYIATTKFNKQVAENFDAILAQARLIREKDFDNKRVSFNTKIDLNKAKQVLAENKFKKLQTFNSIYFRGKTQFQPINKYFKSVAGVGSGNYTYFCKSKGLSNEKTSCYI